MHYVVPTLATVVHRFYRIKNKKMTKKVAMILETFLMAILFVQFDGSSGYLFFTSIFTHKTLCSRQNMKSTDLLHLKHK